MRRTIVSSLLLGMTLIISACVIGPREGAYDREHQRYYHQNAWHDCAEHDAHCN